MNKIITDEEFEVVDQKSILIKLKLDIYNYKDHKDEYVDTLVGGIINGSANIDADSDIRRTFSLTLIPDREYNTLIDIDNGTGYIWIDKLVKISIGIVNERTQEVYWWKFGSFVFTNANTTYDATTNQLTINCSDLMSTLDGSKNGELGQLSIVYPAYKEFRTDVDDVFYTTDITYLNNIYTLKLDNYLKYGLSDFLVTTIPTTNADNPNMRINSLPPLPIVDKENRQPLKAGTLQANKFYAFFVDKNVIVYCSNGSLDTGAGQDYVASGVAEYRNATMESVPHYSFQSNISEPNVGDMFLMHSEQLRASEDYVLPRIPLIEFDSGKRIPILYYVENGGVSFYYTYPHIMCYPENNAWLPAMPDFGYTFPEQGYLRGQKWSKYYYRKSNNNCDPLIYIESGSTVAQRLEGRPRGETEGETTFDKDKLKITYLDDYSYQAEWTRKIKKNGKTKTVTQIDYRTSDIYGIDADYIRQFDKVAIISLPGKIENPNETYFYVFTWYGRNILKKDLPSESHYLECSVRNTIQSRNEYKVNISGLTSIAPYCSITCKINKSFSDYDQWYKAGIPWKNNPYAKTDEYSKYWFEGCGGVPQTFPYGVKELSEEDFYVSSTKKVPLKLNINNKYFLKIVDEDMNPLDPSAIADEEKTYTFLVDKRCQYAIKQASSDLPNRPLVPEGVPINYYTIRKAILTTVGQLAHIKRDTCEVDDVGEYKAMPKYNPDYQQYREEHPLWDNIPYDLEFSHGDTVLAILQKLRDLYPNYECYFDENGTFCTNMIPSGVEDEIIIPEKYFQDNIISENTSVDLTTVRNVCHAWGPVFEPDFYCDSGIYTDGTETSKYVDIYDLNNHTDYTKVVVTCFDAGTNTYICSTDDLKIEEFYNGEAYWTDDPYYCLYTTLPKLSTGIPVYIKYHYTYNTDGSIKKVEEEPYDPDESTPEYSTIPSFQIERKDGDETITYPRTKAESLLGNLKLNQYYELLMYKTVYYHISSSEVIPDIEPISGITYTVREITPIRFYEGSNCVVAEIAGYDQYMTGDVIAVKMADNYDSTYPTPSLNINNLGPIPIYDENTYDQIEEDKILPNNTYCFKIKKTRENGMDSVAAYLLGSWQAQGLAALVESEDGDPNQPYTTTSGVTVNKYSKEYFQEIYACPEVRLVVIPESPFTCEKIGEIMSVYIDETNLTSDQLCSARAYYEIYLKARLIDSITVTTKLAPFADVNYKVGYRRQDNKVFAPYVIKSISHDLSGGTTTWQLMKFFPLYDWVLTPTGVPYVTLQTDDEGHINVVNGGGVKQAGELVHISAIPRIGYHLDDWNVKQGGVIVDDDEFTMPNNPVVIQAVAAPNVVNITYDGNCADDPLGETITYGILSTLNDGQTMEHPYEANFLGWSEESTDTEPKWPVDTTNSEAFGYANDDPINYQTLYAIWRDTIGLFYTGTDDLKIGWSTLLSTNKIVLDNGYIIPGGEHTLSEGRFSTEDLTGDLRISKKVISIDDYAFYVGPYHGDNVYRGKYLTGVKIPSSITTIGSFAFCNDTNLATLDLSEADNLTLISNYAFANSGIKNLSLNGNNLNLYKSAFEGCNDLETIEGLEHVNAIGQEAFADCDKLSEVTIPSSVNELYPDAFAFCDNLSSFIIEEGDTRLQTGYASLLREDEELSYVQIPDSLRQPVEGDEYGEIPIFRTGDQVNDHYPLLKTAGPIGGGYNVEYGYIEVIPEALFEDLHYLEEASIPNTITEIRGGAFQNCKRLLSIIYDSTISDWNNINKGSASFLNVNPLCRVYCTDGDIPLFDNS